VNEFDFHRLVDDEWEWYIAQLFFSIIKGFHTGKIDNVVEICPGYRHKIGIALSQLNFKGNLFIVDNSSHVTEFIKKKYFMLLPKVNIVHINKRLQDCFDDLPKDIDLFLGNHSFDDMVINNYNVCFGAGGITNREDLLRRWEELSRKPNKIEEIKRDLVNVFMDLIESKNINTTIMSQYKSNAYFAEIDIIDIITKPIFTKIKNLYAVDNDKISTCLNFFPFGIQNKIYNDKKLLANTQNAENWLVWQR